MCDTLFNANTNRAVLLSPGTMISIIIPTFNRANILKKAIESYLSQKFVDEIFIINDASTDATEEVIEELKKNYSFIRSVKHDANKGLAASRIEGIEKTKNDLIIFGEDDVIFENDYVEKLYICMQKHDAGIVGGRIISIYENENKEEVIDRWNKKQIPLIDYRYIEGHFSVRIENDAEVPFIHAIYLSNKKVYKNIKLQTYYKGNEYREETDLQISVAKQGYKIMYCPDALCYHIMRSMKDKSGCHSMNKFSYEFWTIMNNNLFLKRNHEFLIKYGVQKNRLLIASDFAVNRILYYLIYAGIGSVCKRVWLKYIYSTFRKSPRNH